MTEENKMDDVEHIGSLKEKLLAVSNEIDTLKNSFSKSAEDLSRIQNMLNVQNLDEINGILQRFESKVVEEEKKRTEAADGAKKYSEELEKEKERLIKLWDAYKNQEEELSAAETKAAEHEEQVRTSEASKKQIEEDYTARIKTLEDRMQENESKANQFDEYRQRCEDFDNIRNQLENEIYALKEDVTNKENTVNDLNDQISKLSEMQNYAEYKEKYETMNAEYEKEKERLTKLYQLYEETDSECKRLTKENKDWQNWYSSNKEIFNKLFATSPPIETAEGPWDQQPTTPAPLDNPTKKKGKKTKKKLRFKK